MDTRIGVADGLDLLMGVMPVRLRGMLERHPQREELLEVVLDLGRLPEARFTDHKEALSQTQVTREDLDHVAAHVGAFGQDNRAGIERTLHRISAIRNRAGSLVGLTCRVGRALFGTVAVLRDVIESDKSLLLLGRPGVGKTTLLREAARVLADEVGKRVVIVDTSNEIAGDGDVPHPGIGQARRMQVPMPSAQHAVMIEAVENHMPEVIVIDEIGTEAEALAARTIAERGVQLIATAHGNTLENLIRNPTLADLIGGIQAVTLSDEEARRRRTRKTVLERKAPPTFDVLIEIQERDRLAVHHDVAQVVDGLLRGHGLGPELRVRKAEGGFEVVPPPAPVLPDPHDSEPPPLPHSRRQRHRIFPYAVNRGRLQKAIQNSRVAASVVEDLDQADVVLTLKSQEKRQPKRLQEARARGMPFYSIRHNTATQMESFLAEVDRRGDGRNHQPGEDRTHQAQAARMEAEAAVHEVMASGRPVELAPRNAYLRRVQHELAGRYELGSESRDIEPYRRVIIYPRV
jgi:stage III sporulation protein SpoIIIAA